MWCIYAMTIKGALCSFGEYILVRRERSALTDFFYVKTNQINTLFVLMTE